MRILITESRETLIGYARNQMEGEGHAVTFARTYADAEARLRSFEGGPFDILLTTQYVANGLVGGQPVTSTEASPLIALAATVGILRVGVLVLPSDDVGGQPNGFGWTVVDGTFAVGETRGFVLLNGRQSFAPKPWNRLLAALAQ